MRMSKTREKNSVNELDENLTQVNQQAANLDLSLLRGPIATSVTGLEEVLRAYNDGTNELKKLLSKECDLIYECKVCRNIFRSLTNFISHKRVYCRTSFNASDHFHFRNNGFMVQDTTAIIEAEQRISNNPVACIVPGVDDKSKDLSGVVEHILWKQHQFKNSNVADVMNEINNENQNATKKQDANNLHENNHTLLLNSINDSDIAVYQSLQTENSDCNMKDEIKEVHNLMKKSDTVLGPDGKILNLLHSNHDNPSAIDEKYNSLICQVCNLQFETTKTLKLHLEMKHLPSAYVYQCPSCQQKFSTSAAVIKHLSNDHKKSNRRIRLMRDNIIKKRVRADESSMKTSSTSRELQQLKISCATKTTQNNDTDCSYENIKNENKIIDDSYICPSCLKKFDRKAVYTSHVQMCSDIKDREQEKLKKQKAKNGVKIKQQMGSSLESEDNSSISEQHLLRSTEHVDSLSKRKRKKVYKAKAVVEENNTVTADENSEDIVDWNLDDEEENKKLENIKKEIIEDEYLRNLEANNSIKREVNNENSSQDMNDDEDSGLIIDEKVDNSNELKCPTCDKIFPSNEKLKYHLTYYHSRQKRFKCRMCEYQGYRKKDTMNHINFVHGANVTLETLNNYTETVSKAVNEEDVKIQNELKKNQLKIKRKMARERQRKKIAEAKLEKNQEGHEKKTESSPEVSFSGKEEKEVLSPEIDLSKKESPNLRRKSVHTLILSPDLSESNKKEDETETKMHKTNQIKIECNEDDDGNSQNSPTISNTCQYEKDVKNVSIINTLESKESSQNSRPIRNRIKPVRKDFLYDLSDLLKKEADAHREQVFQSSNVTVKRELRKRAMSTHTRETPSINTFDQPLKKLILDSLVDSTQTLNNAKELPNKLNDQKNRRMSVFVPPTRTMFSQPRSPPYRPPPMHKNAGAAYKMAMKEFDKNRASLYEPKFLWTICFEYENENVNTIPTSNISTAASILQRLSGKVSKQEVTGESSSTLTAEQLCRKFELINVTNINELDIPVSNAINLNPGVIGNNLMSLALDETDSKIHECRGESDDDCEDSNDDDDDDSITRLQTEDKDKNDSSKKSKKKVSEKRKSTTVCQRRLTVMQRLQENKIRKSREQLFQRFINQQNDSVDSPCDYEIFTES